MNQPVCGAIRVQPKVPKWTHRDALLQVGRLAGSRAASWLGGTNSGCGVLLTMGTQGWRRRPGGRAGLVSGLGHTFTAWLWAARLQAAPPAPPPPPRLAHGRRAANKNGRRHPKAPLVRATGQVDVVGRRKAGCGQLAIRNVSSWRAFRTAARLAAPSWSIRAGRSHSAARPLRLGSAPRAHPTLRRAMFQSSLARSRAGATCLAQPGACYGPRGTSRARARLRLASWAGASCEFTFVERPRAESAAS